MRKLLAGLLALLVLAGVGGWVVVRVVDGRVLGGDPADAVWSPPPRDPGAQQPPTSALDEFYSQELDWERCGEYDCSWLTVPLDYDRPRSRTIDLAVVRVRAQGPAQGALVVNPGGPGSPGTEYAASAGLVFGKPLLRNIDIVGFDPRGTGSSAPIDCLTDKELDAYLASDPSPDDAGERRTLVRWLQRFGRGCQRRDPALAAHVSTVEAARDMDVLRAALGQGRLDYFGASYGTKLGATYAELFPDKVGRFVLDGAIDLSLPGRELSLGQARGFETALRAYVAHCVETVKSCFLGDSVEQGLDRISDFIAEVDASPLPTGSGRQLTVGNAFLGMVTPLYVREYWFLLSQALRDGFEGDGTALLRLADLYASRQLGGGYANNSQEAFLAINCLDDPAAIRPAQVAGVLDDFRKASPTFGDVFAWGMISCLGQEAKATEPPPEVDGSGAAPILVIGTTRDPATPYEWAEGLAEQLESGVLVSRDGDGHTGYLSGNECVDDAVEDYLIDGVVPEGGLRC